MSFFENLGEVLREPKYWLPAPPPAPPIPMWISNWIWDIIARRKKERADAVGNRP